LTGQHVLHLKSIELSEKNGYFTVHQTALGGEMLLIIIWILCSVICGVVAKQKNLNVPLWAALGLFFGIFAVVGIFAQKPKQG
jgi:hypothetical protein